jgi:hypothetical protein
MVVSGEMSQSEKRVMRQYYRSRNSWPDWIGTAEGWMLPTLSPCIVTNLFYWNRGMST